MHKQVATKTVVGSSASSMPAVEMIGGNAVSVTFEVVSFGGSAVTVTVQEGNDLQNWTDAGNSGEKSAVGAYTFSVTGIASRYVRLSLSGAASILSAEVETKKL